LPSSAPEIPGPFYFNNRRIQPASGAGQSPRKNDVIPQDDIDLAMDSSRGIISGGCAKRSGKRHQIAGGTGWLGRE